MQNDKTRFKKEFKERIHRFVLELLRFIDGLPKDRVCNVVSNQLLRSGTSVLANYVEAQAASSKKDFINFFHHSLKSANESGMWLTLLRDTEKGNALEVERLLKEISELSSMLASSILTMKNKKLV